MTKLGMILAGCEPGQVQTVGLLQVIPLISDIQDDRFGPVNKAMISTSNYGSLVVKNPTEKIMLLPKDSTYITKQAAQDHALTHVGIVRANTTSRFDDAACVQQSQGGYMPEDQYELSILPFPLREKAMMVRYEQSYNKLWGDITRFNQAMGVRDSGGHLEYFASRFETELSRFVAEFENEPNQVGAIILLWDDTGYRVVGIERSPNTLHWRSVWKALIRDCYGALAMLVARDNRRLRPDRRRLNGDITSLADLKAAYERAETEQDEAAKAVVRRLADEEITEEMDVEESGNGIDTLSSERYIGQVVKDGNQPVYASLVMTDAARKFKELKEFVI